MVIAMAVLSIGCGGREPAPARQMDESAPAPAQPTAVFSERAGGARRTLPTTLDVDGDGTVGSQTDALLILRHVAGFDGKSLIEGAVGPGCQRCTAEEIGAYIDSL
jgi:hypothetical protein